MPAEWARHARTWMEFPPANETNGDDTDGELGRIRRAWAAVVNAIAAFEPVTLICNTGDGEVARQAVDPSVAIVETAIDECWFRDSGPTFVVNADGGRLGAVHWRFNGWGQQDFCVWDHEQHVGAFAAAHAGADVVSSAMVNEGGGIHVDGDGTALITRTVQMDPMRNPGWSAADVEAELMSRLGLGKVLWVPRGLTKDYERFGTRGHIDMVAAFVRPGVVVAHVQADPAHPDHDVCRENIALLRSMTDARGRNLEVVELEGPIATHHDGGIVDWNYVNHYVCNGAVILCAFDDPRDVEAADTLSRLYPDRQVVLVDARTIFERGGGIHCITQQQPAL